MADDATKGLKDSSRDHHLTSKSVHSTCCWTLNENLSSLARTDGHIPVGVSRPVIVGMKTSRSSACPPRTRECRRRGHAKTHTAHTAPTPQTERPEQDQNISNVRLLVSLLHAKVPFTVSSSQKLRVTRPSRHYTTEEATPRRKRQ